MGRKRIRAGRAAALVVSLGLAACTAQYRNHGYVPDEQTLSQITLGVDTRDSVRSLLGTPTMEGMTGNGDFYYVRSQIRTYGSFRPEVVSREVMAVSFNEGSGTVRNIETFGLEDGNVVVLNSRTTSSTGSDRTFIRQMLGNLGNYDASSILGSE